MYKEIKYTALTFILAVVIITLSGCASVGTEMDTADFDKIEKGVTTRAEMVQMFGKPYTVGLNENGERTAHWIYSEARNRAGNFIPIVGALNMKIDQRLQQLVVIFDENDVVKSFTFNESESVSRAGLLN